MDNQRESYFANKAQVKNKIKTRFQEIIELKKSKKEIESDPYQDALSEQVIRFLNKYIEKLKNKAKKEAEIYLYG